MFSPGPYQFVFFRGHDYIIECHIILPLSEGKVIELDSVDSIENLDGEGIKVESRFGKTILNLLKKELSSWDYQSVWEEIDRRLAAYDEIIQAEQDLLDIRREVADLGSIQGSSIKQRR